MKTGIHALASLDQTPVLSDDLAALDLQDCAADSPAICLHACAWDAEYIGAAAVARDGESECYFLGDLDEHESTVASLEGASSPATVALAAMRRWGPRTTDHLAGEWALLYWDAYESALWLGASRMLRDKIYFAFDGRRVGVSSDFTRLSSVHWIGATFDSLGIAYALSSAAVRQRRVGRTIFQKIHDLEAGVFHRFAAGGSHRIFRHATASATRWRGGFDDAVAAIERRLTQSVRASLSHHRRVAVLLSGGLDSAVVARFLAETKQPHQEIIALTAAAPPGSGLRDEGELGRAVAEAFGIEQRLVWPDENASIFRPSNPDLTDGHLALSPRHYLLDAMFATARRLGATAIYDGASGEMSVSGYSILHGRRAELSAWKQWALNTLQRGRSASAERPGAFLIPPSPELLSRLPADFVTMTDPKLPRPRLGGPFAPIGLRPGYHKAWRTPTSVAHGGLRHLSPLRDRQLVCMIAGMPNRYTSWHGQDRALARALLRGRVPEHVASQPKGMPFSVDYDDRFRREMPQIMERVPTWREAGLGEWLDLDWIEQEVGALIGQTLIPTAVQFRLQLAALAAENLLLRRQWAANA